MNKPSFARAFSGVIALALTAVIHPANAQDMLSPSGSFAPTLTFNESHSEKMVVLSDPADPASKWADVGMVDVTNLTLTANIAGMDPASIGADTRFTLDLGDLSVQFTLGEDPSYSAGKSSVFIPTHGWDADGKPLGREGLSLSWANGVLTVKLVNSANSQFDMGPFYPAFSQQFIGDTNSSIRKLGTVFVSFGDLSGSTPVYLDGTAATTTQTFTNGDYTQDVDLTQAKLKGVTDATPPKVTVTGPKSPAPSPTPDENGEESDVAPLTLSGTASDGFGIASIQVSLTPDDPSSWQEAEAEYTSKPRPVDDEWAPESVKWTFPLWEEIGVGTTQIAVRAIDAAGNVSPLETFTIVKDLPAPLTGQWDALVSSGDESAGPIGRLSMQASKTGKISGRLTLLADGRTYPFVGNWSGSTVRALISRPGLTSLALVAYAPWVDDAELAEDAWLDGSLEEVVVSDPFPAAKRRVVAKHDDQVDETPAEDPSEDSSEDPSDEEEEVTSEPPAFAVFGAFRSPYSKSYPLPAEMVGRYNAKVSGPESQVSIGTSAIALVTRPVGTALVFGRLADGTPMTWAGKVGSYGLVPTYAELYAQRGFAEEVPADAKKPGSKPRIVMRTGPAQRGLFSALLNFDGGSVYGDNGVWIRPAGTAGGQFPDGFQAQPLTVQGQLYTAPEEGAFLMDLPDSELNATISFSGDGLDEGLEVPFTVTAKGAAVFSSPNDEGIQLSFNSETGALSGLFKVPGSAGFAKFSGLIIGEEAVGYYIASAPDGSTQKRFGSVSIFGDRSGDEDWSDCWPDDETNWWEEDPSNGEDGGGEIIVEPFARKKH